VRRDVLLDLICINSEGLVGDVKVKGSLGCSDYKMLDFRILRAGRKMESKLTILDSRTKDFGIFCSEKLLEIRPWREGGPKKTGSYSRITFS